LKYDSRIRKLNQEKESLKLENQNATSRLETWRILSKERSNNVIPSTSWDWKKFPIL